MTISDASHKTGLSVKMIRYYEEIGLIPTIARTAAGYRSYSDTDLHRLHFIRRARALNFSMPALRSLLTLWDNKSRNKAHVRQVATTHINSMRQQITELEAMVFTLQTLVDQCTNGNDHPNCPILSALDNSAGNQRA